MRAEKFVAETPVQPQRHEGNLIQMLLRRQAQPDQVGARTKQSGRWVDVTWRKVIEDVRQMAAGLLALGVQPEDRVAIFAGTSLSWVIADLAVSAVRGVCVPIYASNTPDEVRYILEHSGARWAFVDHDEPDAKQPGRLTRIRQRWSSCPALQRVIVFEGEVSGEMEVALAQLLAQGQGVLQQKPTLLEDAASAIASTDPACFIYTSGTTGDPKGVILTHGNWSYEGEAIAQIGLMQGKDSVLLFLPLAHSFGQAVKAAWLSMGFELIFAESIDKLVANLAETRPTILPAVPRVFEKVYNGVVSNGTTAPGLKGKLFRWAFKLFDAYVDARIRGVEYSSVGFLLAQKLVFAKVQAALSEKLGGNLRLLISGSAPLSRKIAYFFDLIGLKVLEGYGLTETSAAITVNLPARSKIGTVGPALPRSEVKIASDGEILLRGPGVMPGYYRNDAATSDVLDPDGWFHSGDIGEMDADGFVRITDRKKDIIVTSGGKNVAPQNLENALKTFPLISQAMVYGDKRPYLSVLICVAEEAGRKLLAEKGATPKDYAELSRHPEITKAVQGILDTVNVAQPSYMTLKRFSVVPQDFSQETGELTPTLKVKRKVCTQKYQSLLDGLYSERVLD